MSTLALPALVLGITNHLYFKQNEPTAQTLIPVLLFLLTQPLILGCLVEASIRNISLSYIFFLASLAFSVAVYRLSPLHPLHPIPGPWLARLTRSWRAYVCVMGKQYLTLKELHDQYGPIVRTGPNEVSVNNVGSIKDVLGPDGLPKGRAYVPRMDPRTKGSVIVLSGEAHRNRRRLWNRGMNTDSLKEYEEIIRRRARELSEALARASRKAGSIGPRDSYTFAVLILWLTWRKVGFVSRMALSTDCIHRFGGGSNMMARGQDEHGYLHMIEDGTRLRNFGIKWSTERVQRGGTTKDLWYHLSDEANLENDRPALATIAGEGVLDIVAGSDTTSAALAYTIYYLLQNPECYQKAREEVDRVFIGGTMDALDAKLYGNLDYLAACINESLRLMPPVPSNGPREVTSGGKVLCGKYLPEGTQDHRSPVLYTPKHDRWLPDAKTKGYFTDADAFVLFSYGPANCAGRNLAKREMTMVLALLLQQFDMHFGTGEEERWVDGWVNRSREYLVTARDPLWVVLGPR
ncbi:hypothetical protein MPER_12169 [Moniliophthora perniciosa FA553]|nr:hypothetical protein MPER_12169 [Moniliophthora perniciosa FA553]